MATQSDERLLALVREGHERAFEALVNRYRRPLLSYCRRLPLPEARAEDVLQQALLKTWIALRDGAEVRDLKAWLYRVVHNTAVNAVRDAAHDRELLADPTLRAGAGQADLERGLVLRDALAGVAALPSLQREVVVRTAVGGHSHERVARELGITDGAVRGLLYRARATLRTALTALTPPPLLALLAGRADQSGLAPERLGELAAGGGAAGLGGLLVKGGVAAITAGTLITGAAVVHIQGSAHPRARTLFAAVPHGAVGAASGSSAASTGVVSGQRSLSFATHGRPGRVRPGGRPHPHGGGLAGSPSALGAAPGVRRGGRYEPGSSRTRGVPTVTGSTTPEAAPQSDSTTTPNAGSSPGGGASGQAQAGASQGGSGASQGGPAGSAAGAGSGSEGSSGGGSGGKQAPAGGESSGGSTPPSGGESSGGSTPPDGDGGEGSGGQSGASGSGSSDSGQSGGAVGTVVHEVGNLLEHLLH